MSTSQSPLLLLLLCGTRKVIGCLPGIQVALREKKPGWDPLASIMSGLSRQFLDIRNTKAKSSSARFRQLVL